MLLHGTPSEFHYKVGCLRFLRVEAEKIKKKVGRFLPWNLKSVRFETSVNFHQTSRRHIPEESIFQFLIFCWPCISLQILGNNQLDALFHVFVYFMSLHVSSVTALIIRRSNCITTSSGMISLRCMAFMRELHFPLHRHTKQSHILIIPDYVLTQFDLLMMSAVTFETCRDVK